jgi:hypothetical protein
MIPPVSVFRGANSVIAEGGQSVVALYGGAFDGYIINPQLAQDQNLSLAEVLFVDPTGPAALQQTGTTVPLQPGEYYRVAPGQTTDLWVNAVSAGHRFTSVLIQPTPVFTPIEGPFPPSGPTTMLEVIKAYLYKEYQDDDDLQAFIDTFNGIAQNYVDTFNALNLPIYTGPLIVSALLDWVAEGIYGMSRPALSSGQKTKLGPFNTYRFNTTMLNKFKLVEPDDVVATSDDVFKRILTWHLYKGDGKVFNVRWLKRRIMRFLLGENGTAPHIDQTNQISVTFGGDNAVSIRLISSVASITKSAIFNTSMFNSRTFNEVKTQITQITPLPNAAIFQEAVRSGVLELPFQYTWSVTI